MLYLPVVKTMYQNLIKICPVLIFFAFLKVHSLFLNCTGAKEHSVNQYPGNYQTSKICFTSQNKFVFMVKMVVVKRVERVVNRVKSKYEIINICNHP